MPRALSVLRARLVLLVRPGPWVQLVLWVLRVPLALRAHLARLVQLAR